MNQEQNENSEFVRMATEDEVKTYKQHEGVHGEKFEQDCFGAIVVSDVSSSHPQKCLGSELGHTHFISMTIHTASMTRNHGHDYVMPENVIIRLRMTKNQWSDMVASFGKGSGTPVTLERIPENPTPLKACSEPNIPNRFENEQRNKETEFKVLTDRLIEVESMIMESKLSKGDKESIRKQLLQLHYMFGTNFDFYKTKLRESMDDVVTDAKRSLEGYALEIGISPNQIPKISNGSTDGFENPTRFHQERIGTDDEA